VEGEGMALVVIEDSYFGFDHRPKSTRDILRYRYWSYLHKVISRRLQILKSLVRRYFYFPTVSGAHDLCSNNSDVFHITSLHKTLR
jgi:hypothetical protein